MSLAGKHSEKETKYPQSDEKQPPDEEKRTKSVDNISEGIAALKSADGDKNKNAPEEKVPKSDQAFGIRIDSPNSNVRIQGSKIEVSEKPVHKRDSESSEVILKVPDPNQFFTKTEKKPIRSVKSTGRSDHISSENRTSKSNSSCEHRKNVSTSQSPIVPRTRPERTAKSRAKDSITEMTESEMLSIKELAHQHRYSGSRSPARKNWPGLHSPSYLVNSRDYYTYDYYPERAPPSPTSAIRRHDSRSPIMHQYVSPDRHIHSPPLHSHHGRPLSPVLHRHAHSPPRHIHNHSPRLREHEEHVKHLHFTEPLSPHYRNREPHYYYAERSISPYYHEYRHEKEKVYGDDPSRRSPTYKHSVSPSPDVIPSIGHKHDTFPFVHLTEPRSPGGCRSHRRELHSPHNVEDGRFPYGHVVDWDVPKYRRSDISSPPTHSPSLDPDFQYQPLSRMPADIDRKVVGISDGRSPVRSRKTDKSITPDVLPSSVVHQTSSEERGNRIVSPDDLAMKRKISPDNMNAKRRITSEELGRGGEPAAGPAAVIDKNVAKHGVESIPTSKNVPLSFYPTEQKPSKESSTKSAKHLKVERPVIEIPEENMRIPAERKTSTGSTKRKGIGNLLEMKIQGLKKQRLEQLTDSNSKKSSGEVSAVPPTTTSNTEVTIPTSPSVSISTTKTIKSITSVINSLSANAKKEELLISNVKSSPVGSYSSNKPSFREIHSTSSPDKILRLGDKQKSSASGEDYSKSIHKSHLAKSKVRIDTNVTSDKDEPLSISNIKSEARGVIVNSENTGSYKNIPRAEAKAVSRAEIPPRMPVTREFVLSGNQNKNAKVDPVPNTLRNTKSSRSAKSLNLDNIAKNLSKFVEQAKNNSSPISPGLSREKIPKIFSPIKSMQEVSYPSKTVGSKMTKCISSVDHTKNPKHVNTIAPIHLKIPDYNNESSSNSKSKYLPCRKSPRINPHNFADNTTHSSRTDSPAQVRTRRDNIPVNSPATKTPFILSDVPNPNIRRPKKTSSSQSRSGEGIPNDVKRDRRKPTSNKSEANTFPESNTRLTRARNFRTNLSERALSEKNLFENFEQITASAALMKSTRVDGRLNTSGRSASSRYASPHILTSRGDARNVRNVDKQSTDSSNTKDIITDNKRLISQNEVSLPNPENEQPLPNRDKELSLKIVENKRTAAPDFNNSLSLSDSSGTLDLGRKGRTTSSEGRLMDK